MHIDLPFFYRVVVRPLIWLVLAVYFLLAVALVVVRYAVLPAIDEYRPAIERLASRAVGAPVGIGRIDAEWRGLHPSFELGSVQISDPAGRPALSLPKVAGIFSWRSLLVFQPRLLRLEVEAPELELRRDEQGRYWIAGWSVELHDGDGARPGLRWLLAQREVIVRGALVRWTDAGRGAPPLEIRNVAFVMQNAGRHHRAALRAEPPAALGSGLDLRADFTHNWFAFNASDPDQWRGRAYLSAERLDLAGWQPWLGLPVEPQQGTGSLQAWADYERGRVRTATARLAMRDLRVQLAPALPVLAVTGLDAQADLAATTDGYALHLTGLEARTDDGATIRPERLSASWRRAAPHEPWTMALDAAGLDLDTGRRLADRLPLPPAVRESLAELQPDGRIEDLHLAWRGLPDTASDLSGRARFSGLSMAAAPEPAINDGHHPQRPGFSNLQGTIEADERSARIAIEARDAVLRFPGVFADPDLPLDTLSGQAAVSRAPDGVWRVDVAGIDFSRSGVHGQVSGSWTSQGRTHSGTLDLQGRLARADVREVHRYIPIVAGATVRSWLQRALVAGEAQDVDVRVRGDLGGFPYGTDKSGEFRVAGKVSGVTLDYLPEPFAKGNSWPRLEELTGDLVFDRASMAVDVRSGRVRVDRASTVSMGPTRARIARLDHDPVLQIDGQTQGPAPAFLAFVKGSPVGRMIGGALEEATASGNFTVPLSLRIPLGDGDADAGEHEVDVKGEVRLAGNEFRLAPAAPALTRLSGVVGFDNHGIALREVTGMALDGPVRLSGGPRPDGSNLLEAQGTAAASALTLWWNAPGMARLSGRTAYKASVRIDPGKTPTLLIESDLVGLAADLPAPLGKTAEEARPSRLEWSGTPAGAGQARRDWIAGSIGPAVNLHIERDHYQAGGIAEVRGAIGINRAATLSGPGLSVSAELPEVDVDALRKVAAEFRGPAETAEQGAGGGLPQLQFNRISLSTPVLRARGRQLDRVRLFAVRQESGRDANWRADIESAQLAGRLSWGEPRDGKGPNRLSARLSRLVIAEAGSGGEEADAAHHEAADEDVPEIDLVAEHFELFGKELGRLEVLAHSSNRGREWRLRKLNVKNPEAELDGTGVWKTAPGQGRRSMSLDAVLKLADTGKFLERMGVHGAMAGGSGTLSAQVSWQGLPYDLDVPSLSGKVELALDKGQFLKAEPGIAKLLGVLSLQSLPRRVTLDFRDIFSEGFAYDTIRAHATITDGVAHTDDFKMNGVNATVVIAGETDLEQETQRLQVVVVPKLDAGAASLLYGLAVNPAVGLSVFLAQLLLKDPLSKVLAYQYEITGTWTDPQVQKAGNADPDAISPEQHGTPPMAEPEQPVAPTP
ncbi:MAG: YhdP family protein [Pigmentiphaga sp.]|uniref:YhdP family protein n=1 Tax=Pigmentiphaga sp. TaxID=1977564 RepID=UPI0029A6227D|nr:YhdP family protein [Pigmentiphaga sp.]MDX3906680.1 YhdP family protein [Pigmentiphaga sp.]